MIRCPFCRSSRVLRIIEWKVKRRPKIPRCVCIPCRTMFAYPVRRAK